MKATAEILKRGYAMMPSDLGEIMPYYGYAERGGRKHAVRMLFGTAPSKCMEEFGAPLASTRYRGQLIIYSAEYETVELVDFEDAKRKIDETVRARVETRLSHYPRLGQLALFEDLQA